MCAWAYISSTIQAPEVKLRSSGLVASAFAHRAISLALVKNDT